MFVMSALRRFRFASEPHVTLEQLADAFGVNKSTVLRWEEGKIPAERVLDVERQTGVSRSELRPDLYPVDLVESLEARP
jgi:DNA-binding transcriptional regulator YdaS (Cro superfamily)